MASTASVAAARALTGALVKPEGLQKKQQQTSSTLLSQRQPARADFLGRRLDTFCPVPATSGNGALSSTAEVAPEVTNAKPADAVSIPASGDPKAEDTLEETSSFLADVASLIKLVDSRDIVELELKHKGVEISIRKKEALAPPPAPAAQQSFAMPPQFYAPSGPPTPAPTPSPTPAPAPAASAPPPRPAATSSGPAPMASPMAGTFYRCPAPGEPAFVKQGDRVVKGQVICIIEAMKLMNEVEADQSGTIAEILAEDGKPIAAGAPLFKIVP